MSGERINVYLKQNHYYFAVEVVAIKEFIQTRLKNRYLINCVLRNKL